MIRSIQISNFQSHKETLLELSPGVNAIIGPSDSGKTAIIRALRWLVWNRPLGDDFRSDWGGDTSVILKAEETSIERRQHKSENSYFLEATEFRAFGTGVPEEIQRALNINDINLQQQLDRPFLLDDSPGAVAQHFNKVANLDMIDKGTSTVQKWLRAIERDIQTGEDYERNLQAELEEYAYLKEMEEDVFLIEQLEERQIASGQQIGTLKKLLSDIVAIQEEIDQVGTLLPAEPLVVSILKLYDEAGSQIIRMQELEEVLGALETVSNKLLAFEEIIELEDPVNTLLSLYQTLEQDEMARKELQSLLDSLARTEEDLEEWKQIKEGQEEAFHNEMPDQCPLCGAWRKDEKN